MMLSPLPIQGKDSGHRCSRLNPQFVSLLAPHINEAPPGSFAITDLSWAPLGTPKSKLPKDFSF